MLALASAAAYGFADFAGGVLSRRANFAAIALLGQVSGFVLTLIAAPMVPTTAVTPTDVAWGALSGVGTGLGMMFLYKGLSRGSMSVVVPVSAVGGVSLPVLVGVALLGDRPSILAWTGIAIAVPTIWLVSRTRQHSDHTTAAASRDGLLASVGIALQYIALAQSGPEAGIWPVVAGRLAATLTIAGLMTPSHSSWRLPTRLIPAAAATGAIAALALVFYLVSTREQLVVIAVVLSSLYPAIPVIMGILALREKLNLYQAAGIVGAAAAIGFITIG